MKTKKIRGHRRRWEAIDQWVETHQHLDLDYLKKYQQDYAKIRVHPWSGITLTNSRIPAPKGETKTRILHGLIEIYDTWKQELDKLGRPYYLKLWLFEPRFSTSQVVCAIGDCLDFYENTFYKPDYSKDLKTQHYGQLENEVVKFNWDYRLDEDHYNNTEPGSPNLYSNIEDYYAEKRRFDKMLHKSHRITKLQQPIGEITECYSFKKGDVWLGGK